CFTNSTIPHGRPGEAWGPGGYACHFRSCLELLQAPVNSAEFPGYEVALFPGPILCYGSPTSLRTALQGPRPITPRRLALRRTLPSGYPRAQPPPQDVVGRR